MVTSMLRGARRLGVYPNGNCQPNHMSVNLEWMQALVLSTASRPSAKIKITLLNPHDRTASWTRGMAPLAMQVSLLVLRAYPTLLVDS